MGNVLRVIFRYFIDTQAGGVRVERLLLHKGDASNVLPTAIAHRSVPRYDFVYRVQYRAMCIAINQYRAMCIAINQYRAMCIVRALIIIFEFGSFGAV